MSKQQNKNVGPIVGTLIVIIVLIVAAVYVFTSHINQQAKFESNISSTTIVIHESSNDDIKTLKNDLNSAI